MYTITGNLLIFQRHALTEKFVEKGAMPPNHTFNWALNND